MGVIDPRPELCQCWHVTAARSVSKVRNGRATIKLLNPTDKDIDITTGVCLGFFEDIQEIRQTQDETDGDAFLATINTTPRFREEDIKTVTDLGVDLSGSELTEQERDVVITFLAQNKDILAKDFSDLGHCTLTP